MNQYQYTEVTLNLNEVIDILKSNKDCLATVELEDDNILKCYVYPIGGQGINVITSFILYHSDYKECINDEDYKNWLQTCFAQELIVQKDGTEYEVKIKLI